MDLETLKTFLTLSKLKNFTQTANELFVVQSTITNRILELEKQLGKKLFIRDKKSVELTEAGKHLIPYAERMIEIEIALTKDLNLLDSYEDLFRIGTVNTIYDCYLQPMLTDFMKMHPEIVLKVFINHSSNLFQMLQDGAMDIIFTYLPFHHKGYVCQPFRQDHLSLVTHPSHTEYINGITKDNLSRITYLYCDFFLENGEYFIRDLFPSHFTFPFEIDRATKLIDYLLEGIGYSFLPKNLTHSYVASHKLIEIPLLDFTVPTIQSYTIVKSHASKSATIQTFSSFAEASSP